MADPLSAALLAVLTAFTMGFAVVVFEASLSSVGFGRFFRDAAAERASKTIVGLIAVYLLFRFGGGCAGKLGLLFAGDLGSLMFLLESALFIYPMVVLMSPGAEATAACCSGPRSPCFSPVRSTGSTPSRLPTIRVPVTATSLCPGNHGNTRSGGVGGDGLSVCGQTFPGSAWREAGVIEQPI